MWNWYKLVENLPKFTGKFTSQSLCQSPPNHQLITSQSLCQSPPNHQLITSQSRLQPMMAAVQHCWSSVSCIFYFMNHFYKKSIFWYTYFQKWLKPHTIHTPALLDTSRQYKCIPLLKTPPYNTWNTPKNTQSILLKHISVTPSPKTVEIVCNMPLKTH